MVLPICKHYFLRHWPLQFLVTELSGATPNFPPPSYLPSPKSRLSTNGKVGCTATTLGMPKVTILRSGLRLLPTFHPSTPPKVATTHRTAPTKLTVTILVKEGKGLLKFSNLFFGELVSHVVVGGGLVYDFFVYRREEWGQTEYLWCAVCCCCFCDMFILRTILFRFGTSWVWE